MVGFGYRIGMGMQDQTRNSVLPHPETAEQTAARVTWERKVIEKAEAQAAAGDVVEWSLVEAWLVELDHDPDAPPPSANRKVAAG